MDIAVYCVQVVIVRHYRLVCGILRLYSLTANALRIILQRLITKYVVENARLKRFFFFFIV